MMKAYEFALDKVGIDVASGNIWSDYVNFIKVIANLSLIEVMVRCDKTAPAINLFFDAGAP